jgi:large subunit ribosomal protein L4
VRRPFQQRNARRDDQHIERMPPLVPASAEPHLQAWLTSWDVAEQPARAGIVLLRPDVWDMPLRPDIIHRCVLSQQASRRTVRGAGKRRGDVRGGGRKPRPQKGTGRSRQGSIRAPHYRGGGVAHPRMAHEWAFSLPRQVASHGVRVALSDKYRRGALLVVEQTELESAKTKLLVEKLSNLGLFHDDTNGEGHKVLIVGSNAREHRGQADCKLASQNIPWVSMVHASHCSVLKLVQHSVLLIGVDGIRDLEARFKPAGVAPAIGTVRRTWPPSAVLREYQAASAAAAQQ